MKNLPKYSSAIIVLLPVLSCYAVGPILLYKFLMFFCCIFFMLHMSRPVYSNKSLRHFYIYAFTVPIITAIALGALSHLTGSILTPLLFGLCLVLLLPYADLTFLKKYYRVIVIFACVVFFLQELSFLVYGRRFSALIPFLDLPGEDTVRSFADELSVADRSSSIFKEPSHFAQYLAPYFALALGDLHAKKKVFSVEVLIITIVFMLLRSGNGLLLCGVLWIVSLLFSSIKKYKKYLVIIPLFVTIAYIGYVKIGHTEMGEQLLERSAQLQSDQERVSSGYIRIYRGFMVYGDMGIPAKVLGVGPGGANDMIERSQYFWMFTERERYLNNASAFLISYGIIGTLLFLIFLLSLCKRENFTSILLVISFIVLSFMENFFFDPRMLLYIGLLCLVSKTSVSQNAVTHSTIIVK